MDTKTKLNQLAELEAAADLVRLQKQELIDKILTPEITQALAEIEMEFVEQQCAVNEKIAALQAEIRQDVIEHGASVKGDYIQAVYSKPRVSWDNAKLEGLMMVVPQLEGARKVGQPSVSFRKV